MSLDAILCQAKMIESETETNRNSVFNGTLSLSLFCVYREDLVEIRRRCLTRQFRARVHIDPTLDFVETENSISACARANCSQSVNVFCVDRMTRSIDLQRVIRYSENEWANKLKYRALDTKSSSDKPILNR